MIFAAPVSGSDEDRHALVPVDLGCHELSVAGHAAEDEARRAPASG